MSVNDRQVDGRHYRAQVQCWDFVERNGLGYLEGQATKYITRSRKKHDSPIVDWEKAIHYIEKLRELYMSGWRANRSGAYAKGFSLYVFASSNDLNATETRVVELMVIWEDSSDLTAAIEMIRGMISEYTGAM